VPTLLVLSSRIAQEDDQAYSLISFSLHSRYRYMETHVRVLVSDSTNPWFNLATEDWIFRELDPHTHTLFLWRNDNTVVIGRHQNPWVECKVDKMEADGVFLARRQSGGGAVFHDLGNTNFTFLSSGEAYDQDANFSVIIDALATFGITAERSGRNDILAEGRKVSGSAFKHTRERSFHHGTLLIDADLGRLVDYLNPHEKKLVSKGIKSVRSRVANLKEFNPHISHEGVCTAVTEQFFQLHRERCEVETLDEATLSRIPSLDAYYRQMADWDWRFGKTPDFTHHMEERFDWGGMDIHLDVHRGVITEGKIYSDAMDPAMITAIEESLPGTRYHRDDLSRVMADLGAALPERRGEIDDVRDWFVAMIG
jgi:lipoate---protein ligase